MLTTLRIKDLALIEKAEVDFAAGLCALTGESGAGKSLLLDGLALLAGSTRPRVRPKSGAPWALIEGEFSIDPATNAGLAQSLTSHGLPVDDTLVLSRRLEASGRTRSFVQGQLVPRTVLSEVAAHVLELTGQGDSHALRQPAAQLQILDHFAGTNLLRGQVLRAHRNLTELARENNELNHRRGDLHQRADFLDYQLEELKKVSAHDYEARSLELERLEGAARSSTLLNEIVDELSGQGSSIDTRLAWLLRRVASASGDVSERMSEKLALALEATEEACRIADRELSRYADATERLGPIQEELGLIRDLARKHRVAPDELAQRQAQLEADREEIRQQLSRLEVVEEEVSRARESAMALAEQLHEKRKRAGSRLSTRVDKELRTLGMPDGHLSIHLSKTELGPSGLSHIDMGFSSSVGQNPEALGKVASGGELCRVLLALRLATDSGAALLIFDEVDSGTGGETATKVGQALARAASTGQVLCVTHWPQVAGLAKTHLKVEKETLEGRTISTVSLLDESARVAELTRMLGGSTATARSHAVELRAVNAA